MVAGLAGAPALMLLAGVLTASGTGCATHTRTIGQAVPTSEPIVLNDEAMEHRQWEPATSYYASGTTNAYPTRWNWQGYQTDTFFANAVIDPLMFGVETVTYPFRLITDPPGEQANYAGQVVPPTYNAMPPLPPEPAPPRNPPSLADQGKPFGAFRDFFRGAIGYKPKPPKKAEPIQAPAADAALDRPANSPPTTATEPAPTQPATTPAAQ